MPFIRDVSANYHSDKPSECCARRYTCMVHVGTYIALRPHCGFRVMDPQYRDILELHCTYLTNGYMKYLIWLDCFIQQVGIWNIWLDCFIQSMGIWNILSDWTAYPIRGYMKHLIWLLFIQNVGIWNILSDWTTYPTCVYMKYLIWLDCLSNLWVYETSYLTGLLIQPMGIWNILSD